MRYSTFLINFFTDIHTKPNVDEVGCTEEVTDIYKLVVHYSVSGDKEQELLLQSCERQSPVSVFKAVDNRQVVVNQSGVLHEREVEVFVWKDCFKIKSVRSD